MASIKPYRIKTISEFHQLRGLPKPEHPLISVINLNAITQPPPKGQNSFVLDFYSISLKRGAVNVKYKYGQQEYGFYDGVMFFLSPKQVFGIEIGENSTKPSGWILHVHPDFFWNTPLAKTIKKYEYFGYSVNEALLLSEKEEAVIINIIQNIHQEYHSNIDKFSQDIIISQIETLLNYAERFYHRQFITRKKSDHQSLDRLEKLLSDYFNKENLIIKGLPTVQYISETLNVSPTYLRGLLKMLTGQSTQQHIHDKLIEKAKEKLSTTDLSVSEIAYDLGFAYSQSFSKLFKTKTNLSPLEFRRSFN
jgi:AraC-like DNA-binding protein